MCYLTELLPSVISTPLYLNLLGKDVNVLAGVLMLLFIQLVPLEFKIIRP
jgi:hypothetical protein